MGRQPVHDVSVVLSDVSFRHGRVIRGLERNFLAETFEDKDKGCRSLLPVHNVQRSIFQVMMDDHAAYPILLFPAVGLDVGQQLLDVLGRPPVRSLIEGYCNLVEIDISDRNQPREKLFSALFAHGPGQMLSLWDP